MLCGTVLWCFIAGYRSFQAEMLRRRQLLTRSFAGERWNPESRNTFLVTKIVLT
jgi:hypothetical protein